MILNFMAAIEAQSVLRFSLYHLVDEVGGLNAPPDWHFLLLDVDLLC